MAGALTGSSERDRCGGGTALLRVQWQLHRSTQEDRERFLTLGQCQLRGVDTVF